MLGSLKTAVIYWSSEATSRILSKPLQSLYGAAIPTLRLWGLYPCGVTWQGLFFKLAHPIFSTSIPASKTAAGILHHSATGCHGEACSAWRMPLIEGREKGKTAFGQQVVEIMGAEQEPLACKPCLTKERKILSSPSPSQVQLSCTSYSQGTEKAMHAIHAPHLIAWKNDTDDCLEQPDSTIGTFGEFCFFKPNVWVFIQCLNTW